MPSDVSWTSRKSASPTTKKARAMLLTFISLYKASEDTFHFLGAFPFGPSFLYSHQAPLPRHSSWNMQRWWRRDVSSDCALACAVGRSVAALAADAAPHAVAATVKTVAVNSAAGGREWGGVLDTLNAGLAALVRI